MPVKYFIVLPGVAGSFEEECRQCLNQLVEIRNSGYTPLKINIFIEQPDFEAFLSARKSVATAVDDAFKDACPALSITVQPPERSYKIAIEAAFIVPGSLKITSKSYKSIPYIICESESGKGIWAGGVSGYSHPDDTRIAAVKAFDLMLEILENEKMSADNIVRQWNYIGNILNVSEEIQNYQIFNEVRSEYYHRYRNTKGYPAATGIGMKHGGVILDFFALKPDKSVIINPVSNPDQVNAYDYGQQVLKGFPDKRNSIKHPPQFERGLILSNKKDTTLFISGTAAIIGQDTIGADDIGKQTLVTIENIRKVADRNRISSITGRQMLYEEKFSLLRVYIKRQNDFKLVRTICSDHFPQIPAIFLEADICRDDLLVEIEAEVELN
ncbi:MAG: dioxygenase [Bacteroidales bacterium]|nr:dioxygenase [Bacteroidales bacterium]